MNKYFNYDQSSRIAVRNQHAGKCGYLYNRGEAGQSTLGTARSAFQVVGPVLEVGYSIHISVDHAVAIVAKPKQT